jgi:molybdate transport system ATP-binding protein
MLDVRVEKRLGEFHLKAALQAPRGVTALFGPSGAGKTSLVNLMAGLLEPDSGRIALGEKVLFDSSRKISLPPEQRGVGLVFQDGRLFPHMSVKSNLMYGLRLVPPQRRHLGFDEVVELMGIGHLLKRRPAKLSGGEKQRVAVGRALLSSPRLLLMDEPLASLDQARKQEVLPFLARLPKKLDLPIIYVSHSSREVNYLADRVINLSQGEIVSQVKTLKAEECDYLLKGNTSNINVRQPPPIHN